MWSAMIGEQAAGGVGAVGSRAGREFDESVSRLLIYPLQPDATGIDGLGNGITTVQTRVTGLQPAPLYPPVVRGVAERGVSVGGSYYR